MSITNFHLPSLSIFLALFTILVAKTCFSIQTLEFIEHFLDAKKGDTIKGLDQIRQYLIRYGYMNSVSSSKVQRDDFDNILAQAVKKYQLFSHLDPSGVLDTKTLAQMAMPRCGTPDFVNDVTVIPHGMMLVPNMSNRSYYTFVPTKWHKFNLTWALEPGTRADAHLPIEIAFALWASVSKFKFIKSPMFETSDLKISFAKGDHGDGVPFEGRRVLAHAFYPPEGMLHFNADKNWKDGRSCMAYDIGTIGLHEMGHLLGLGHSKVKSSIMWPYTRKGLIKGLHQDDIAGIKALYPS